MSFSIILMVAPALAEARDERADPHGHSRLAQQLRAYGGSRVEVMADQPGTDVGDAFLGIFDREPSPWILALPSPEREAMLGRTFLLLGDNAPGLVDVVQSYGLAGAVETRRYLKWKSSPDEDNGYGVIGLRVVVDRIGAKCADEPFCTEGYCLYGSPQSENLPQAIAEYLRVLTHLRSAETATRRT